MDRTTAMNIKPAGKWLLKPIVIAAISVFIVNLIFKLIHLNAYPLWYDECFSIFYSQGGIQRAVQTSQWDICPPFYLIVMFFWTKLFGISEFSVRFLSVLCSSAAAVILLLFVKRFFNMRMAIIASVIFIASNVSFFYSHEARAYSFIQFFSIATAWIFFEFMEKPDWKRSISLGICYYVLFMTHYLTAFIMLWQALIVLCFFRKDVFRFYVLTAATSLVLLIHWMPRLFQIMTERKGSPWLPLPDYNNLWDLLYNFYNGKTWFWIFMAVYIVALIMIYGKISFTAIQKQLLVYAVLLSIGTVLAGFYFSAYMPMFLDRYLLFSLTGFILITSFLLSQLPVKNIVLYTLLVSVALVMLWQIDTTTPKNMDFRSAATYVKSNKRENTLVVIQTIDVLATFTYYYDPAVFKNWGHMTEILKNKNIVSANDSAQFNQLTLPDNFSNIILVQAFQHYADPGATLEKKFSSEYIVVTPAMNFDNVLVTEYKKRN